MEEPKRPDETGIALLQALHVLNEWENQQLKAIEWGQERTDPVHSYAWGLFKTTLLKAVNSRQDLKDWSPQWFDGYQECKHCDGQGRNAIPTDSPEYREYLADDQENQKRIEAGEYERTSLDTPFNDGDPLWYHCTPCQGSGILTALDVKEGRQK